MRKIFVVIERRADYSRFKPILMLLRKDPFFTLHIVVTGLCLLSDHGYDIKHIKEDGFHINKIIPMFSDQKNDTGAEMVRAMSRFMIKVVDELESANPDIVLSGFDIGANFATTVAAAHMNIPVFHIQGGEISGSIDESLRHAMSKFAHFHFPATELSKKRLIKMGENPKNIFVVGCPSIDVLKTTPEISVKVLEKQFMVNFKKPVALCILHPVTTENMKSLEQIKITLRALQESNIQVIFLFPNNDSGYLHIINEIKRSKIRYYRTLSTTMYINLLRNIWVLVGNSSSGIHEAATYSLPVINIGSRQNGREKSKNVIDVAFDKEKIEMALKKAVYDQKFRKSLVGMRNIYGTGDAAKKIVKILKEVSIRGIIQKEFYE